MEDTHKHEWKLSYTIKYKGKNQIVNYCKECGEFQRKEGELPKRASNMGGDTVKDFHG